jgi:hypothetical protein
MRVGVGSNVNKTYIRVRVGVGDNIKENMGVARG